MRLLVSHLHVQPVVTLSMSPKHTHTHTHTQDTNTLHRVPQTRCCLHHHLHAGLTWTQAQTAKLSPPPLRPLETEAHYWQHTLSTLSIHTHRHSSRSLECRHDPTVHPTPLSSSQVLSPSPLEPYLPAGPTLGSLANRCVHSDACLTGTTRSDFPTAIPDWALSLPNKCAQIHSLFLASWWNAKFLFIIHYYFCLCHILHIISYNSNLNLTVPNPTSLSKPINTKPAHVRTQILSYVHSTVFH